MGTFLGNTPDVSGVPIREVTPSTLQSIFYLNFGDPPGDPLVLQPGRNNVVEAGAYGAWPLWTRSVVSWSVTYTAPGGACLHVEIGDLQVGGLLVFYSWRHFGLYGQSHTINGMSGLEIPAGVFARFTIIPGTYAPTAVVVGSLTLRGV